MRDYAVVRVDPDEDRQRHAVLHDQVDITIHELVEVTIKRRKHALHVLT